MRRATTPKLTISIDVEPDGRLVPLPRVLSHDLRGVLALGLGERVLGYQL